MIKTVPFKLSFKIFQWMLVAIIVFSTYLGYQFYQITFQSQAVENQRFWIVSKLNNYRLRTDNLSFYARHYLIGLDAFNYDKYHSLKRKKSRLIYSNGDLDSNRKYVSQYSNAGKAYYRPFSNEEKVLLSRVIAVDFRLRELETNAFNRMVNRISENKGSSQSLMSGLQNEEYLRLNLDILMLINEVFESVNKRFKQKMSELEGKRSRFVYVIPMILCLNLILIIFSFFFINKRMDKYHTDLERLTLKDFLTGVHNRRYLVETGPMLLALNKRENTQVAVLMLDIDNFKTVNDRYGHDAGDEVLKAFSNTVIQRMRQGDIFARFGGEEFILMLNKVTAKDTEAFANDLRILLANQSLETKQGEIKYTVSIGIVMSDGYSELKKLISNADKALYTAKNSGRDRVVMFNKEFLVDA